MDDKEWQSLQPSLPSQCCGASSFPHFYCSTSTALSTPKQKHHQVHFVYGDIAEMTTPPPFFHHMLHERKTTLWCGRNFIEVKSA
eukprot:12161170-Ditylum_brightwellii.AAC.1